MAEVKGKLVTCDRCGATCFLKCTGEKDMDGGFTRWNTFEALPEGWKIHSEVRQLCPECNEEYEDLIHSFMNNEAPNEKSVLETCASGPVTVSNEPNWFIGEGRDDILG